MAESGLVPMSNEAGRLRLLDGIRLVAALSVMAFHYTARLSPAWGSAEPSDVFPMLSRLMRYGGFGVELFFIISGFVVLMSAWGRSVPVFVASRVSRLFPAYWFAILFLGLAFLLLPGFAATADETGSWEAVLANLTMLQPAFGVGNFDGVAWTLFVEILFYVWIGILCRIGVTAQRVMLFAAAWPVVGMFVQAAKLSPLVTVLQPNYAPFFAIGMMIYLIYRNGWSAGPVLVLILNWVLLPHTIDVYALAWIKRTTGFQPNPIAVFALYTVMILVIGAVTLTPLARVRWRWLTVAGALTYPLYLIHESTGRWLISLLRDHLPRYLVLGVVALVMLVFAYAVHRWVERPIRRPLRRSLERSLTGARDR